MNENALCNPQPHDSNDSVVLLLNYLSGFCIIVPLHNQTSVCGGSNFRSYKFRDGGRNGLRGARKRKINFQFRRATTEVKEIRFQDDDDRAVAE